MKSLLIFLSIVALYSAPVAAAPTAIQNKTCEIGTTFNVESPGGLHVRQTLLSKGYRVVHQVEKDERIPNGVLLLLIDMKVTLSGSLNKRMLTRIQFNLIQPTSNSNGSAIQNFESKDSSGSLNGVRFQYMKPALFLTSSTQEGNVSAWGAIMDKERALESQSALMIEAAYQLPDCYINSGN